MSGIPYLVSEGVDVAIRHTHNQNYNSHRQRCNRHHLSVKHKLLTFQVNVSAVYFWEQVTESLNVVRICSKNKLAVAAVIAEYE